MMNVPIHDRVSLDSTTLAAAAYNDSNEQLELGFRDGTRYVYFCIAAALYRDLLRAVSKGVFFNQYIRDHFPYAKLPTEKLSAIDAKARRRLKPAAGFSVN